MGLSQYGLQDAYKRAKAAVIAAYISSGLDAKSAQLQADNAVLSQSYLRLEQELNASSTNYTFPVLNNQNAPGQTQRATEVRLAQQDCFFASSISIYLANAESATATNFQLLTYPSPGVFTLGGAAPAPLNTFYNGYMSLTINKSVIIPNYPLLNFYQIPQTQLTAATNSPQDQFDPTVVSLWEPNISFVGTKQSNITIVLPSAMGTIDEYTYAVIELQGVLAQNVTLMS